MPTRFNTKSQTRFGVPGIKSGYEHSSSSEVTIPPCGLEDVDEAVFKLFSDEMNVSVVTGQSANLERVKVIFAGGEKWAMVKRSMTSHDRNRSLKLPMIAIGRTGLGQAMAGDITGRGTNQHTGELVVKRKLDSSDRNYQALVNKLLIKNQDNLSVPHLDASEGQLSSNRVIGEQATDPDVVAGALFKPSIKNNVYEILVVPTPQFYTITYEIMLWAQYTQHINSMIETIMSSMLPQVRGWRIDTKHGYWFVARVADDAFTIETNFDDMSTSERMIQYKFNVSVQAALFASRAPGVPIPVKRYVSSPEVSFDISADEYVEPVTPGTVTNPFLGVDDPTLPRDEKGNHLIDQRETLRTNLYPNRAAISPNDPALDAQPRVAKQPRYKKITFVDRKGKTFTKHVRVSSVNPQTGETTFSTQYDMAGLTIAAIDDVD